MTQKYGIGYGGDSEMKIAIGFSLGDIIPISSQW
jgi:hypothetical protein